MQEACASMTPIKMVRVIEKITSVMSMAVYLFVKSSRRNVALVKWLR